MARLLISIAILMFAMQPAFSQEVNKVPRFWEEVQTIKKYDKIYKPLSNPIVFVGSSTVRVWNSYNEVFGKYNILNRGIGGAKVNDVTFYINDLVLPYSPRQVFIYVGGNDFMDVTATPDTVYHRSVNLFKYVREKLPNVPISYISMHAAPKRAANVDRIVKANQMMKEFIAKQPNAVYIDLFNQLRKDGKDRPELFVPDMVHLNRDGYAVWEKVIGPYLIKPTKP